MRSPAPTRKGEFRAATAIPRSRRSSTPLTSNSLNSLPNDEPWRTRRQLAIGRRLDLLGFAHHALSTQLQQSRGQSAHVSRKLGYPVACKTQVGGLQDSV